MSLLLLKGCTHNMAAQSKRSVHLCVGDYLEVFLAFYKHTHTAQTHTQTRARPWTVWIRGVRFVSSPKHQTQKTSRAKRPYRQNPSPNTAGFLSVPWRAAISCLINNPSARWKPTATRCLCPVSAANIFFFVTQGSSMFPSNRRNSADTRAHTKPVIYSSLGAGSVNISYNNH